MDKSILSWFNNFHSEKNISILFSPFLSHSHPSLSFKIILARCEIYLIQTFPERNARKCAFRVLFFNVSSSHWIPAGTGCQRSQVKIKAEDTASGILLPRVKMLERYIRFSLYLLLSFLPWFCNHFSSMFFFINFSRDTHTVMRTFERFLFFFFFWFWLHNFFSTHLIQYLKHLASCLCRRIFSKRKLF